MNYKSFNLGDWIGHISGVIEDETTLDGNEMRDLVEFLSTLEQEPTTKNDLAQERYQDLIEHFGDEKVAKTILESRKEFKAWLERLRWNVKRVDELARELEQLKGTTKNDLGVDCISRADARKAIIEYQYSDSFCEEHNIDHSINTSMALLALSDLPSVTPQEPKTKIEESNFSREQYVLDIDTAWKCGYEAGKKENSPINICPHCGEYIGEEE